MSSFFKFLNRPSQVHIKRALISDASRADLPSYVKMPRDTTTMALTYSLFAVVGVTLTTGLYNLYTGNKKEAQ